MAADKTFSTLRTLVNRNAALFPKKVAVKEYETGKSCTFIELKERVNKIGNALRGLGARKGDRVAILSQNSAEYLEVLLGVTAAGFIFVPVNFRLAVSEVIAVLGDSEPLILIVEEQYLKAAEEIRQAVPSIKQMIYQGERSRKPEGWLDYTDMLKMASPAEVKTEVFEDDVAVLMYTSGTTGVPKGVMQTHLNHYHDGRAGAINNDITTDDIGFVVCPMYHVTAYTSFLAPFFVGATSVAFQKWDPENLLKAAQDEKLTAGMLATPMVRMLLDVWPELKKKKYDHSTLTKLWFAGAGIIPSVYKQFVDIFGPVLGEHHGTTETSGVTTNLPRKDVAIELAKGNMKILESCGRTAYDMEVLIVDDDDKVVTPPGIGEMKVRGLGTSPGYWRKEEQTKKAFRGEWFFTEDVCAIDEKGYVYVIDRKKDMIITGGENVYPAEIEKVVNGHPAVKESSAIGVPHPVWGEAVAVVVCVKDGQKVTEDAIIKHCKGKIAGYKTPKLVYFLPDMPRNSSGKIMKGELRKQFSGGAKG